MRKWTLAAIISILFLGAASMTQAEPKTQKATFAGGCFWCMEPPFKHLKGVISVMPGYTGGHVANPTYEEVSTGTTGHAESVEVTYDPSVISYQQLLDVFWRNIDPTTPDQQFADHGPQYRTAIFYHDAEQKRLAETSKQGLIKSGQFKEVVTEITAASPFYPAEDYHREYYKKNPARYKMYRMGSGRDGYLQKTWGTPPHSDESDPSH
jgi:methionine-S-sulfoxide reductase